MAKMEDDVAAEEAGAVPEPEAEPETEPEPEPDAPTIARVLKQVFDVLEVNGDGYISEAEFLAKAKLGLPMVKDDFHFMDGEGDSDGRVSFEEWGKGMAVIGEGASDEDFIAEMTGMLAMLQTEPSAEPEPEPEPEPEVLSGGEEIGEAVEEMGETVEELAETVEEKGEAVEDVADSVEAPKAPPIQTDWDHTTDSASGVHVEHLNGGAPAS